MSVATLDGLTTHYEMHGTGPPVLMLSPGGFDASLDRWRDLGRYRDLRLLDALATRYTCILFDRRESGRSGGRVERLSWSAYVAQAAGLLDHLGVESAHVMGGCIGCSTAIGLAVEQPPRVRSMVLFSPAGGVHYRIIQQQRFARHLAFVAERGLRAVHELARSTSEGFSQDPRVGPWAAVLRNDEAFAERYIATDPATYEQILVGTARLLFDRDTVPGPEPEDLLGLATPALIVPGDDRSHAPSAALYLRECLPVHEYWDTPVEEQSARNVSQRILEFLDAH